MSPAASPIRTMMGPWESQFAALISSARNRLLICSPFISVGAVKALLLARRGLPTLEQPTAVLTNLNPRAVCQGATDPRAALQLADGLRCEGVFHLPSLHAKVYIADAARAAVTSGNLTDGGVRRNHEYGLMLSDVGLVGSIEKDLLSLSALGSWLTRGELENYVAAAEQAREAARAAETGASARVRSKLAAALASADESLIRARLRGGPIHRVFTQTIRHLLGTHGPMPTVHLHAAIQRIHPDLCDDTVDRVIDGERFGKKWKHAVRTSQQQLKRLGEVALIDGSWRLIE
ncbi:MAG: phospholipase D family protein [Phycisphaerales bacterium]